MKKTCFHVEKGPNSILVKRDSQICSFYQFTKFWVTFLMWNHSQDKRCVYSEHCKFMSRVLYID